MGYGLIYENVIDFTFRHISYNFLNIPISYCKISFNSPKLSLHMYIHLTLFLPPCDLPFVYSTKLYVFDLISLFIQQ